MAAEGLQLPRPRSAPRPFDAGRLGDQLRLAGLWFAGNAVWESLSAVLLPFLVLQAVGDARKAVALSLLTTLGTLLATAVHPVAGWASDRTRTAFGRRRPYVLGGGVAGAAALCWLAFASGFPALLAAVLLLQLAYNTALAAYQAYIPEIAPPEGRGRASGFLGLMSSVGALVGAIGSVFLVHGSTYRYLLALLAAILLGGVAVTVWGLPEGRVVAGGAAPAPPAGSARRPGRYRDFVWVVVTRGLVMLGFYTLLTYLSYYLRDVAGVRDYVTATSYTVAVTILAAAFSTVWAGRRSDAVGRRTIVCAAGALMGVGALAFLLARGLVPILAVGAVFGLGYGAYISVDWALVTDVLPDAAGVARDMGFWGMGTTLPQVIAPVIGGIVFLLLPAGGALPYRLIFGATALYAFCGSALVWKIRGVR
jgi:MFS family permease